MGILEEQSRCELEFGKTQLGIEKRTRGVDVEVGDPSEDAWFLPTMEAMSGAPRSACC
jgi:hypothetical protein